MTDDPASTSWHLDKRVPAALIFAIVGVFFGQTFAIGVWVSQISERLSSVERTIDSSRDITGRIVKVEAILERVERKLDRLAP